MDGATDIGVPHWAELVALVDATIGRDSAAVSAARTALIAAVGQRGMLDTAAVIGGFDGITKVADATGIPLEPGKAAETADWRTSLGIDRFVIEKT